MLESKWLKIKKWYGTRGHCYKLVKMDGILTLYSLMLRIIFSIQQLTPLKVLIPLTYELW